MQMIKSFIALVTPFNPGDKPDQGLPGKPPGRPDQGLPGSQPGIDNTLPGQLPRPEHPIFFPLPPGAPVYPDIGLPGDQPGIDNTLPGQPGKPDQGLPPFPSHPIVLPPDSGGWLPVFIWGPNDPRPGTGLPGSQPGPDNTLPGSQPRPDNTLPPIEIAEIPGLPDNAQVVAGWTPDTGWVSVVVIVPEAPHPTPSKKK
jgi:hypothetical protein